MNPFVVLGISANSTEEEVRRAYRTLSLQHHPDKAESGSTAKFQEISNAYDMIRDQKLCGNNRWADTQTRSRRSDTQDNHSGRPAACRSSQRRQQPEERIEDSGQQRSRWHPKTPSPERPDPRHRTHTTRASTDRNSPDSRGYGFRDADRGVPLGTRTRRRESDFGGYEYRSHHSTIGEHPSASRGFYNAARDESHSRRPQPHPPPGSAARQPRAPPTQHGYPSGQPAFADTFDSIGQRLLHGLHVERQRQMRAGNPSMHREAEAGMAIAEFMRHRDGDVRDVRDLANNVGRIMFLLRRLQWQNRPNPNEPMGTTIDDFEAMARSLGIMGLLDPVIFSHAAAAFGAESRSREDRRR